jgi:ribonuclease BN (tRNA processing enzyme)
MRLEIFGSDGGIGEGLRTTAFLVDDDIMIDAGSGISEMPEATLQAIDHVFLTHAHVDHTALLPLMIDATWAKRGRPITLHAQEETLRDLKEHVFNWKIWPDFSQIPSPDNPALRFATVELGKSTQLDGRRITPVPANHTIPAVGYQLDSGDASLVFSGDTTCCDDLWKTVNRIDNLEFLIIETAFDDSNRALAERSGHLCPSMLADELAKLERCAEVFLTHLKPGTHRAIMDDIAAKEWASLPRPLTRRQVIEF